MTNACRQFEKCTFQIEKCIFQNETSISGFSVFDSRYFDSYLVSSVLALSACKFNTSRALAACVAVLALALI